MLALLGLLTMLALLAVILTKRLSALAALIAIPIIGALIGGFGLGTGKFIVQGLQSIAPVVAMFIFAIIFFSVLMDAGMFDPIINKILRHVGHHPTRVVMGTALLAMVAHLDGSGATTFLIVIPPLIPLYDRLNMDRRVLACVVALGAGTMNVLPWGGPTIRAATALQVQVTDLYNPVIPAHLCGLAFVMLVAYWLGRRETRRLGIVGNTGSEGEVYERQLTDEEKSLRRPKMFWFNIILTVAVIVGLVWGTLSPAVLFMVGATLALVVNYPNVAMQRARVDAHAKAALMMASILLAAGSLMGIMKGTGMIAAMAKAAVTFIPQGLETHIPAIVALISMPMSLLFDPDSFYFGFLPVVAEVAKTLGVPALQVGQAAIIGQMTTGFPLSPLTPSTFLLIGLTGVELGEHQKFTFLYAYLVTIVMAIASIAIGLYPL
ncbi:MAG: citrate transporter [Syntrophaceae bacterium]|nr:citrate transporter [Syntrophaceae bacterium]